MLKNDRELFSNNGNLNESKPAAFIEFLQEMRKKNDNYENSFLFQ